MRTATSIECNSFQFVRFRDGPYKCSMNLMATRRIKCLLKLHFVALIAFTVNFFLRSRNTAISAPKFYMTNTMQITKNLQVELQKLQEERKSGKSENTMSKTGTMNVDCGKHGTNFLGRCFCHPSYKGEKCEVRFSPANPWWTKGCKNLKEEITYSANMMWPARVMDDEVALCFSTPENGIAQIPRALWEDTQATELAYWWQYNKTGGDRPEDHFAGYSYYKGLSRRSNLGNLVEFGAGPFTQTKYMLDIRKDLSVEHVTLVEPLAKEYMKNVPACTYKDGKLEDYPTTIVDKLGEVVTSMEKFDTLLCSNVIEHVHDAYQLLENLYKVLKPGGILIWHERWFPEPVDADCLLGTYQLHPIRLTRNPFLHFLSHFDQLYAKESAQATYIQDYRDPMHVIPCTIRCIYFIGRKI